MDDLNKAVSNSQIGSILGLANIRKSLLGTMDDLLHVESISDFSYIMQHAVRILLPHEISVCGVGDVRRKLAYSLHNFGYPEGFLKDITSKRGDKLQVNSPVVDASFDSHMSCIEVDDTLSYNLKYKQWTDSAKRHQIKNILAVTQFHPGSSLAGYFCFTNHSTLNQRHHQVIRLLLPFLDQAMFSLRKTEKKIDCFMLTIREIQILGAMYSCGSNKMIARELKISDQTVRHHISSILKKMAVTNRTQAIVLALSAGIIDK